MDPNRKLWIAVDFDRTLIKYIKWEGPQVLGPQLDPMVMLVKWWLSQGHKVAIFTARASCDHTEEDRNLACYAIGNWCILMFGQALEVTADKSPKFQFFLDDKAVRVLANVGTFDPPPGLPMPEKSVPELLLEGADLFRERGTAYDGPAREPAYKNFGHIAAGLFPRGLLIQPGDVDAFNRLALILVMAGKLARYANNPQGHLDSAADLKVYGAMLEQITPHGRKI